MDLAYCWPGYLAVLLSPSCRGSKYPDSDWWQYSRTKLMNLMTGKEMARRYEGTGVEVRRAGNSVMWLRCCALPARVQVGRCPREPRRVRALLVRLGRPLTSHRVPACKQHYYQFERPY